MSPDESLRDPALSRLFKTEVQPLPPLALSRRVARIPLTHPRPVANPGLVRSAVLAVALFLVGVLAVWWIYLPGTDLPRLELPDLLRQLPALWWHDTTLPVAGTPGLWLAAGCALTVLALGVVAAGPSTGGRLRRD